MDCAEPATIRSAYASRSSSVQVPSPTSSSPAASPFTRPAGQLLQLDPDDPLALRRPGRIDRARLSGDDRRLGGEEAALGLVDGARDAVEPGRDVDDRGARRGARRPGPSSAAARPSRCGSASRRGRSGSARPRRAPLRACRAGRGGRRRGGRRDAGDDRAVRRHHVAVAEPRRPSRGPTRRVIRCAWRARAQLASGVADDPRQGVDERDAPADGHGHPAELHRAGDHLRHEARDRVVRPEPRVQHPRREQAVRLLGAERRGRPVAAASRARGRRTRAGPAARAAGTSAGRARGPSRDQSSVPSTPKLRSAWAMNSSNCRCHASPSPSATRSNSATFASSDVPRNIAEPSGNAVPVGSSVLTYSRPRACEVVRELRVGRGSLE